MNLAEVLPREAVVPDLHASAPQEALRELLAPLLKLHPGLDSEKALAALWQREELGSTAIGCVAIPHCMVGDIDEVALAVGRSMDGVDFGAPGQPPSYIIFLILAPERQTGQHLRVLAQVARRAKLPDFCAEALAADDRETLWRIITAP
jgi:PTS system nitrogen regulatory IIA component